MQQPAPQPVDRSWRRAACATAVALALLGATACDPPPPADPGGPTTTTSTPATTTTLPTTTTTTLPSTTTSIPTPSTTTTAPDPGGTPLTLRDTGLTRVRLTLTNEAEWVNLDLAGTTIDLSAVRSVSGALEITALGGQHIAARGTGEAVIELVLAVPPDAATSLSMCKNYLGPASVRIDRLTDGETPIASLTNEGTSPLVLPGSCENRRVARLDRTDLIGPVRWPARRDPRPLVLANYYPWYDPEALARTFGDQPVGPADTSDPDQVVAALDLAIASGIDGFVVEYEATPAHDAKVDLIWEAAEQRDGFQLATMIDFAILQHRPGGLTGFGLDGALAEAADRAGSASQLHVGRQPVVFLYGSWLPNPDAWRAAVDRLHGRTGLRPFFVADSTALPTPGQYAYGTHHLRDVPGLQAWAKDRLVTLQEAPGLAGRVGPLWVAPVSPGYDDSRLGRTPSLVVDRNQGVRYEQAWDAALASLPDWIMVTSWNEYYEQTHVMPGSSSGSRALGQTRTRSAAFHTTG